MNWQAFWFTLILLPTFVYGGAEFLTWITWYSVYGDPFTRQVIGYSLVGLVLLGIALVAGWTWPPSPSRPRSYRSRWPGK